MLDWSIPTRKALVHSIPISEVKEKKKTITFWNYFDIKGWLFTKSHIIFWAFKTLLYPLGKGEKYIFFIMC
jgi:hypothetical protein